MKKRGQLTLKILIELVVAFTVFFIFIFAGKSYGSGEVSQKAFIARDTAVMINSFYASSGNGYILYPADVSGFLVEYKDNAAVVSKFKDDPIWAAYPFVRIGDAGLDYETEYPKNLVLGKVGNKIEVYTDRIPVLNKVECPEIDAQGSLNQNILLAARSGAVINGLEEGEITRSIAQGFFIKGAGKVGNIWYSGEGDIGAPRPDGSEADIIIGIQAGNYNHEKNVLKVYHSDNVYSKKLGCLILNNILDQIDVDGANIIPDPDLKEDKIAILIEAGNMQIENGNMLENQAILNSIGGSIFGGLEDYYE